MVAKPQRQHRIAKLLSEQAVTSQTHLVEFGSQQRGDLAREELIFADRQPDRPAGGSSHACPR